MNLRDLMTKLDTIAEADDARAQYDKFKADDARAGAIAQVKTMLKPNGGGNFIDPKDGIVKWQEQMQGDSGGPGSVREFPFDWYKKGQESKFFDILKTAGLEVVPVDRKNLFGTSQVVGIKGGPQALANLDKPQTPTAPTGPTAGQQKGPQDDIAKLDALTAQLEASLKGQGPAPDTTTTPTTTTPTTTTPTTTTTTTKPVEPQSTGKKVATGLGIGAGALAGQQLAKKAGLGGFGQAGAAGIGGAIGGLIPQAYMKEDAEVNSSIAQSLTESFGYEYQLDEYSMGQFGQDASDFGRGAWNGATLGTGDNIVAGVKSAFGPGTYKDELKNQMASSQEAEKRSPWLYGAGNIAGSIAAPIPGGAVAGGLIKGASTAAKLARAGTSLGVNLAAQKGVDTLKNKADLNTLAQGGDQKLAQLQQVIKTIPDGKFGPNTQKALAAWQAEQGLPPTGKPDPATYAKAGIAESKATTVAEDIKSLQDKLAMIESGQWRLEEDADYSVWLLEDGTVVGEQGEVITNEAILSEVNWGALGKGAMNLVKGAGKNIANIGSNLSGGLKGAAKTGVRSAAGRYTKAGPIAGAANAAGKFIAKNPGKAALGAAALGAAGTAAAMSGHGGSASETGTTTGGGGGGADSDPNMPQAPAGDTPGTTPATTPASGNLTPDQQALIKQIEELMSHDWADDKDWIKATGHARVVLDKATKANPLQTAMDAKNDAGATTQTASTPASTPATGQGAAPTGATTPDPTLKVYKDGGGAGAASNPAVKESEDELARWLRIARG